MWRSKLGRAIAWRAPKWFVYWCGVRIMDYATSGQYSKDMPEDRAVSPSVTLVQALERWDKDHAPDRI